VVAGRRQEDKTEACELEEGDPSPTPPHDSTFSIATGLCELSFEIKIGTLFRPLNILDFLFHLSFSFQCLWSLFTELTRHQNPPPLPNEQLTSHRRIRFLSVLTAPYAYRRTTCLCHLMKLCFLRNFSSGLTSKRPCSNLWKLSSIASRCLLFSTVPPDFVSRANCDPPYTT